MEYIKVSYRYLISAKVLDQLEEFEIQPSYERLCRSLHSCAKTTQQMKLLWRTILNIVGTSPDNISTLFVSKVWKDLCNDKKYSHICHYEEELIDNIEKTKVIEKNTHNNNLLSPTDSIISFSYNTDNNNIIKNVETQNNIPIIITTTAATNTNSISQYLPSPNIDQCQKQVQYVQSYVTIPNLAQNSIIYYY
ncbi:hypothetical protein LY90DRAFT_520237 [Neocallimastix californiae]|uniref:Uncharacterized protein n=1 Tax=Neocallimastix californiae TaxID=1754190 RepID=A0A1Y1YDV2_9FUNG|nr:hypothetical protein LY90DRAFT_520237 [Neocallimastix californiae]|eukprot:ORX96125.1 hypothetical protein LY90DRAFT_520237 [Neocallimastix californiae]